MSPTRALLCFSLVLAGASACRAPKGDAKEPAGPAAPAAPASVPNPALANLSLGERLSREAADRPNGTPRSEDVLAALEEKGLVVSRGKQVLGSTIGASYCRTAQTSHGVGLAVCEYASEETARRGREHSRKTFDRLIPNRALLVNRKTLLTVTRPAAGSPEVEEEISKVTNVFGTL